MNIIEIDRHSELFPQKLKEVRPLVKKIYAIGNIELLNRKSIAIIGSRNCSEYGERMTRQITEEILEEDFVIVSGMALGIDGIAHETCLQKGKYTIAVLGSGFSNVYPKEHQKMFRQIIENDGLIISEYPPSEPVKMKNFPRRNRILSGISDGVLVIEGAYRSGTSITAKYAISQGKKVFFLPNCVGNKNSYGVLKLAQDGGILVTGGEDILAYYGYERKDKRKEIVKKNKKDFKNLIENMDDISKKIIKCLMSKGKMNCNQLCAVTGYDITDVNQALSRLELEDIVIQVSFDKFSIKEVYCE